MTTLAPRAGTGRDDLSIQLATSRLPGWAPAATAAVSLGLALGLRAVLGWTGWSTTAATAALGYAALLTVSSLAIEGRRRAIDRLAGTFVTGCLVAALVPLILILVFIAVRGAPALSPTFLTHSMNGVTGNEPGGGIYHALIGTLQQVGLASVVALPIGILTAIYLVEFGRGRFARLVTFFVDVMNGVPSIVAGLFVFTFLLLGFGMRPFGAAGAIALVILMMPIVVRSAEEMIRLVPDELREASYALGTPRWRTVLKVVLPTALSGLVTGGLLAIARVAGETAPLILLVGYSSRINTDPLSGDQASLPVMIWDQLGKRSGNAGEFSDARAWGAALVLVLLVLVLNIAARLLARLAQRRTR
jgi:phosphate transport system permease protein